jgi:hypothetical protein
MGQLHQREAETGMGRSLQKAVCITVALTMALAGCAAPKELEAIPVSPTQYAHLDCEQLSAEAQRLLARNVERGGRIGETVKQEQALVPLAAVSKILWPLELLWLPFVPLLKERKKEDEQRQEEYRRLMGERNAILQAAAEKGCPGVAQQPKTDGEPKTSPDATK